MIYLKLFLAFLKISFFNFGGGFAMISLIKKEIIANHWLSSSEFVNIIAISQITPGAVAINTATFVGYKIAGFIGAVVCTIAIPVPTLFFSLIISGFLLKFNEHPLKKMIFYGIRPVIVGLIVDAAILVSETSIFKTQLSANGIFNILKQPLQILNLGSILILALVLVSLIKYKINPILIIIGSGILGIIIFSLF